MPVGQASGRGRLQPPSRSARGGARWSDLPCRLTRGTPDVRQGRDGSKSKEGRSALHMDCGQTARVGIEGPRSQGQGLWLSIGSGEEDPGVTGDPWLSVSEAIDLHRPVPGQKLPPEACPTLLCPLKLGGLRRLSCFMEHPPPEAAIGTLSSCLAPPGAVTAAARPAGP